MAGVSFSLEKAEQLMVQNSAYDSGEVMAEKQWIGPFRIQEYVRHVVRDRKLRPPDAPGLYVLTERSWAGPPAREANVLYVGQAKYMRYRIGQFLSELVGFTSDDPAREEAYQHRGGHQLWHRFCLGRKKEPGDLYLAWCVEPECLDCAQAKLLELLPMQLRSSQSRTCHCHNISTGLTNGHVTSAVGPGADSMLKKGSNS
jgi:hypothetical protein